MNQKGAQPKFNAFIWCNNIKNQRSLLLKSLIFKGVLLFILNGIYFAPFLTP